MGVAMSRVEAVRLLLGSRDDWLPGLATSTGRVVQGSAVRGEVSSSRFVCGRCGGRCVEGRPRRPRPGLLVWSVCSVCDGAGWVAGDAYTFGSVSSVAVARERVTGEAESLRLDRKRRDGELRRLERLAAARAGLVDPGEAEGWEVAKRRLWREGSYAELERALVALRAVDELDWLAVMAVFGPDAELRQVGAGVEARVERAVAWLAAAMPDRIRVPPHLEQLDQARRRALAYGRSPAHGRARGHRAAEIVERRRRGETWRQIEQATGLSERHARRVYKRLVEGGGSDRSGLRVA
jgi:hypothetical protein